MELGGSARPALDQQQRQHEQHQDGGQLRRRDRLAHGEPCPVDAGREGIDREILHRPEIGQHLHQHQRQPGDDRRPRQGQGHAEEAAVGAASQRPADFQHADRLFQEGGARQQVDVGVQHQRQHDDGAAQRPDFREPVVAPRPAHHLAQRRLHRADELQQVGVDIGHHIGRNRHRQQQRPFQHAAAGEAAHGHQPRRADPDHQRPRPDAQHHLRRIGQIIGQHGGGQMRPHPVGRDQDAAQHHHHRHRHKAGDRQRRDGPPAWHQAMAGAVEGVAQGLEGQGINFAETIGIRDIANGHRPTSC